MRIRPSPNGQIPAMARNSVLLPDPDGPEISRLSPDLMVAFEAENQRLAVGLN